MNRQVQAILKAVDDIGDFRPDVPFLTNAEIVFHVRVGAAALGGPLGIRGEFASTTLKNWLLRGYFRPHKRVRGVRNLLYSGQDLCTLLVMQFLIEFGLPVTAAAYVASEIGDKILRNPAWDGNVNSDDYRVVLIARPALSEYKKRSVGDNVYTVTLPTFGETTKPDVAAWLMDKSVAGALILDWKCITRVAFVIAHSALAKKASQLKTKLERSK